MRFSIVFSILLAATFTAAAPFSVDFSEADEINDPALLDQARENTEKIEKAAKLADEKLERMEQALTAPDRARNKKSIQKSFGAVGKDDIAEIKKNVKAMRAGTMKIGSVMPTGDYYGVSKPDFKDGKQVMDKGRPTYKSVEFGNAFFRDKTGVDDQAGTMIHEAAHYFAGAEDDVLGPKKSSKDLEKAMRKNPQGFEIGNRHEPGVKDKSRVYKHAGYADTPSKSHPGEQKLLTHAKIAADNGGASIDRTSFGNLRGKVGKMHKNADSYRLLASLCHRSLYERALIREDSVGYYLAKRQQCNLPPNRSAKNAAAKSATTAKGRAKGPGQARGTRKATSATSRNDLGTRKGTNGIRKQGRKSTSGAKTTRGRKAGSGVQGARTTRKGGRPAKGANANNRKAIKGSRAARGAKGAKAVRKPLVRGTRGSKGAKATKRVGAARGAKSTRGAKGAKGVKTNNRAKGNKAVKGSKAARGAKGAKAVRKPLAKGTKGAKAANRSKANRGGKTAKGVKGSKAVRGSKGIKGGNGTKGRKVAKGARETTKGIKAGKGVKGSTRGKGTKAAKGTKPVTSRKTGKTTKNTKAAHNNKGKNVKTTNARNQNSRQAAKNPMASKTSNQAGGRGAKGGASKAAAKPKVQQTVTKAAPKKAGKKN